MKQSMTEQVEVQDNIKELQTRLDRLERHDWISWALAFVVMLALVLGLFALSLPVARDYLDQVQVSLGIRGLLALVLLFDLFVIHQQYQMKKLRQDLGTQLGAIRALESFSDSDPEFPQEERRRVGRSGVDRRLLVNSSSQGRTSSVFGRIRDISEIGLGAVIPCSLHIGEEVQLEFAVEGFGECKVKAVVRHRRSFHYGFEFLNIDATLKRAIARSLLQPIGAISK